MTHYIRCYPKMIRLSPAKSYNFQWPLSHLKASIKQKCAIVSFIWSVLNNCKENRSDLRSLALGFCVVTVINSAALQEGHSLQQGTPDGNEASWYRRDFNRNEWEVVDSCKDVLQHRIKMVKTLGVKHYSVHNRDGFFKVLAHNLTCWVSYSGLCFGGYEK